MMCLISTISAAGCRTQRHVSTCTGARMRVAAQSAAAAAQCMWTARADGPAVAAACFGSCCCQHMPSTPRVSTQQQRCAHPAHRPGCFSSRSSLISRRMRVASDTCSNTLLIFLMATFSPV